MCDLCQMQFRIDHETTSDGTIPCPVCGRFYVDPMNTQCYHCFAASSGLEPCDACELENAGRTTRLN